MSSKSARISLAVRQRPRFLRHSWSFRRFCATERTRAITVCRREEHDEREGRVFYLCLEACSCIRALAMCQDAQGGAHGTSCHGPFGPSLREARMSSFLSSASSSRRAGAHCTGFHDLRSSKRYVKVASSGALMYRPVGVDQGAFHTRNSPDADIASALSSSVKLCTSPCGHAGSAVWWLLLAAICSFSCMQVPDEPSKRFFVVVFFVGNSACQFT